MKVELEAKPNGRAESAHAHKVIGVQVLRLFS